MSKIMLISRGHGWGHAVPDISIAANLLDLVPGLGIQFVSYGSGAEAYRAYGHEVIDLGESDQAPIWDLVVAYTRLLSDCKPDLVIAHEEIAPLPIAQAFGLRTIFLTDYFLDPNLLIMRALLHANKVIFLNQRGLFTEPPFLSGKVQYVGRAVRSFEYTMAERRRARSELGIHEDAKVVLCQPGIWSESQVPLVDLLLKAWQQLPFASKRLIWIAGRDYQRLSFIVRKQVDVTILERDLRLDRLMAASDLLITKANRTTVFEAAAIGLPSISISNQDNWPDDVAVANVHSNTALSRGSLDPETLSQIIQERILTKPKPAVELSRGVALAAQLIAEELDGSGRRSHEIRAGVTEPQYCEAAKAQIT